MMELIWQKVFSITILKFLLQIWIMTGGILEVLLVNAEDIRRTNIVGKPAYYVIIQCGTQVYRSRTTSPAKKGKVLWNQKFKLEYPLLQWRSLAHIKFTIMDLELFKDGGFVGETTIHLGGILAEGLDRGFMELRPAHYNVVLEDDTYKGQIKIGFRFITQKNVTLHQELKEERGKFVGDMNGRRQRSVWWSSIINFCKLPCWRFLFNPKVPNSKNY